MNDSSTINTFTGGLVVLSGPSGSGKTTIVERLERDPRVTVAVTATTRPKRRNEQDGVDYYFLTRSEFQARIERGEFVEWNEVFRNGHLYGSLKAPLEAALADRTRYYVLEIDVEGGSQLRKLGYPGRFVFIAPPTPAELRRRIEARGTESEESIRERMKKVEFELGLKDRYDRVVVNDDLERAYAEVLTYLGLTPQH